MAKCTTTGFEAFALGLTNLEKQAKAINKCALWEGAAAAHKEISSALEGLPVRPDKPTKDNHSKKLYGVTASEKAQLIANFGISKHKTMNGKYDVSIGFTGYVNTPSAMFNDNVPSGMLMQAVENGTEFREGVHVIRKASKACQPQVVDAIQKYIDEEIEKIMK